MREHPELPSPPRRPTLLLLAGLLALASSPAHADEPSDGGGEVKLAAMSKEVIDATIRSNLAPIKACYQRRLNVIPDLEGRLVVRFNIENDGSVSTVEIASSDLPDDEVGSCIAEELRALSFPQPRGDGIVIVTYPFAFRSEKRTPSPVADGDPRTRLEAIPLDALSREAIHTTIHAELPLFEACYQRRLDVVPDLKGKVVVRFVVGSDGSVSTAEIASSDLADDEIQPCVLDVFHALRFPEPTGDGDVVVTYPLAFRTRAPSTPSREEWSDPSDAPLVIAPADDVAEPPSTALVTALRKAGEARAKGRTKKAESWLGEALELEPDCGICRRELAALQIEDGRAGEARAVVDEQLARDPDDTAAWALRGFCDHELGQRDEAIEALRTYFAQVADWPRPAAPPSAPVRADGPVDEAQLVCTTMVRAAGLYGVHQHQRGAIAEGAQALELTRAHCGADPALEPLEGMLAPR